MVTIIYSTLCSINITLFKFLSSQFFQRSKDNLIIEESKFSIPVKSKEKDSVEGDKNKVNSEDVPVTSKEKDNVEGNKNKVSSEDLVVKVSNLIEPPRDKDGKILYELMSMNTGIYKKGDHPSTARRQKNSLHCNELCPCPVDGCAFLGIVH